MAARATVAGAVSVGVVATTAGPRRDVDYWWHVLLGRALLAGDPASADAWSAWPGSPGWRTGQPLAEIAMAVADALWQGATPTLLRASTAAAAMATVAATTRPWVNAPRREAAIRWLCFACAATVIMGFSQERPAQVGLMLMPLVGVAVAWWSTDLSGRRSRWPLAMMAVVAIIWVPSHQSWLLAWVVITASVVFSPAPRRSRGPALGLLAVILAAAWWGMGPPWRALATAGSAATLAEWQPTQLFSLPGLPLMVMVVTFSAVVAHAVRAPRGDRIRAGDPARYLAVAILCLAGISAWRHVPVCVLAMGPIVIAAMLAHDQQLAPPATNDPPSWARGTHRARPPLETLYVSAAAVPACATAVLVGVWGYLHPAPAVAADLVADLAARHTCHVAEPPIIATHYNHSGPALWGARTSGCPQSSHARVVIDGRADRYGAATIGRWQDVIGAQGPRWADDWARTGADIAVLQRHSALATALRHSGWRLAELRNGFVVLYRPGLDCAD